MYAQRGGDVAEFHFWEKKFHQRGMVDVVNIETECIHALCSRWFLKGDQAERQHYRMGRSLVPVL